MIMKKQGYLIFKLSYKIYSFSKQGLKKDMDQTDQDSHDQMINELGSNIKYFAVYDGHGLKGREVQNSLIRLLI